MPQFSCPKCGNTFSKKVDPGRVTCFKCTTSWKTSEDDYTSQDYTVPEDYAYSDDLSFYDKFYGLGLLLSIPIFHYYYDWGWIRSILSALIWIIVLPIKLIF